MISAGFKPRILMFCFLSSSFLSLSAAPNVILITLDGVRSHEFFHGTDEAISKRKSEPIFENLLLEGERRGLFFGDPLKNSSMLVSNESLVSLPAYQSMMAGRLQRCFSNSCSRISVETLPERLVRELKLNSHDVATIASWPKISLAVESHRGATFTNAGIQSLADGEDDLELKDLNQHQSQDLMPWGNAARADQYTWAHALRYLKVHQPRFLYIALNDSDEWAHLDRYDEYVKSLRQYDRWIVDLIKSLNEMGDYGRETSILVTTDHSRGDGNNWQHHYFAIPESKNIWLFASTPETRLFGERLRARPTTHSHLDIRPSIEKIFSLEPQTCERCGKPMEELFSKS